MQPEPFPSIFASLRDGRCFTMVVFMIAERKVTICHQPIWCRREDSKHFIAPPFRLVTRKRSRALFQF